MAIKINKKIKSYSVVKPEDKAAAAAAPVGAASAAIVGTQASMPFTGADIIHMHEKIERPEVLIGSTYKIKSPLVEHAMYVTINDIVLNQGTENELRRPFEVFINSKNMDHFQWIVALTRIMSAVFRKGGDVTFLVDEMKAVFDPRGGYFKAGGVYMPSIVAEIGSAVEEHLKMIGMIVDPELSDAQRALIAEKRAAYENRGAKQKPNLPVGAASAATGTPITADLAGPFAEIAKPDEPSDDASFPATATLCHKCNTKALVLMDGCQTCLNCGYSKCG
ncbi:hypothetical protein BH11PSE14_BH11PSE14_01790 [soil metagenome]